MFTSKGDKRSRRRNPKQNFATPGLAIILKLLSITTYVTFATSSAASGGTFSLQRTTPVAQNLHRVHCNNRKSAIISSLGDLDEQQQLTAFPNARFFRGGGTLTLSTLHKEILGASFFVLLDVLFRKAFRAQNINFPSQLGGCIILFFSMVFFEGLNPTEHWGQLLYETLNPGAAFLAKWLPVFFVPGLAMLPLAPSMGSTFEVFKVVVVVVLGFLFSISTTVFSVLGLRSALGEFARDTPVEVVPARRGTITMPAAQTAAVSTPQKPFSDELVFFRNGVVVSASISLGATLTKNKFAIPLQAIFFGFATLASFVWGSFLPSAFTRVIHPIVFSTVITLITVKLTSITTGSNFLEVLGSYKTGSFDPMKTGAGDILLFLLGPAVVAFSVPMYSRKQLMADNLLAVFTAMMVSAVGGLFGTAAFTRLINLGGGNEILRLSVIPRSVTAALAMAISEILGGNMSITASVVVMTGVLGGTFGVQLLDAMKIQDPVSRGLAIGCAGQSLGVASIVSEKDAFPFAAIGLVLAAIGATTIASIAPLADVIVKIALGAPGDS